MRDLGRTEWLGVGLFLALLTGFVPGAVVGSMSSFDAVRGDGWAALATTLYGAMATLLVAPFVLGYLAYRVGRSLGEGVLAMAAIFIVAIVPTVAGWAVGYALTYHWPQPPYRTTWPQYPSTPERPLRMEVPAAGYAIVFPWDWVVVRTAVEDADGTPQGIGWGNRTVPSFIPDLLAANPNLSLVALAPGYRWAPSPDEGDGEVLFGEHCEVSTLPDSAGSEDLLAQHLAMLAESDLPGEPIVRTLGLRTGDVTRVEHAWHRHGEDEFVSTWFYEDASTVHVLTCTAGDYAAARWRPIAQSFTLLPPEDE